MADDVSDDMDNRARTAPSDRSSLTSGQRLVAFATALGVGGAALWLGPLRELGRLNSAVTLPWWAVFVACYLASLLVFEVRIRSVRATLSATEIPVAIGLFVVDPHVLLGCYVVGVLLGRWTRRGVQAARDYSNVMLDVLYIATAVLLFNAVQPDTLDPLAPRSILALAVAMGAAGWVVAPVVLNLAVYLYQGSLATGAALSELGFQIVTTTTNTCLGVVGILLAVDRPLVAVALVPPLILVLVVQLIGSDAQQRAERMQFLYTITDLLHSTARTNDTAGEVLAAISRMFHASRVELIVLPDARGPGVRFISHDGGEVAETSQSELTFAEQEAFNQIRHRRIASTWQHAPDSSLSLLLAERGVQSATLVALSGRERPQGMLLLGDCQNSHSRWSAHEQSLLLTVAGQISAALDTGRLGGAVRSVSAATEEVQRHALSDPLTNIANRALFLETTGKALARFTTTRRAVATLFIDLDGLDRINEKHGRAAGDKVLAMVATRLRGQIRKFDIAGRLGGDEFGLLLDGMRHRSDADMVARRVIETLSRPMHIDEVPVRVTACVGVAVVDDLADVPGPEELLRRADMAMYLAKRQGRGRYVVFDRGARDMLITTAAAKPDLVPR